MPRLSRPVAGPPANTPKIQACPRRCAAKTPANMGSTWSRSSRNEADRAEIKRASSVSRGLTTICVNPTDPKLKGKLILAVWLKSLANVDPELAKDWSGSADCFVSFHLHAKTTDKQRQRSSQVWRSLDPSWPDEMFLFVVDEGDRNKAKLFMECYDKDLFHTDDSLGHAVMLLRDLCPHEERKPRTIDVCHPETNVAISTLFIDVWLASADIVLSTVEQYDMGGEDLSLWCTPPGCGGKQARS